MSPRACRKIYSQSQIGLWIERVSREWESKFGKSALEMGREFYRSGKIQVIELNSSEAIISAKLDDGREPYGVLDFDENGDFDPRCSDSDDLVSEAIAVAGMYEIEELVGDVVSGDEYLENPERCSPLPEETPEEVGEAEADSSAESEVLKEDGGRKIVLTFTSRRKGLSFSSVWSCPDGKSRKVFGEGALEVEKLSDGERERLVSLASLARKSGFHYDSDLYVLSDISRIPQFVVSSLSEWEKYFEVKCDENVKLLALGERSVKIESFARGERGAFSVEWTPKVDGKKMDPSEMPKLVGSAGTLNIVPSFGIVRMSSSDGAFVRRVEETRGIVGGKIPRYILLSLGEFGGKLELSAELKKWVKSLLGSRPIKNLPKFLRNYQKHGVSWAANLFKHGCGAMIADEMGLGKTIQALALVDRYSGGEGKRAKKFLVVCPASVITVWSSEAAKFFPNIKCGVFSSGVDLSSASLWISSYTQLRRNRKLFEKTSFELAVLDEAQFIKNPDAKTTAACMSIRAKRKIALTGTPVENKPLDLWSAFRWLMPGLMGTRANFEKLLEAGSEATASIRRQISPFVLRRLKSEVASELPEKVYVDLACPMSPLQTSEYSRLLESARAELKNTAADSKSGFTMLSLLTRLRQAACDASLLPWIEGGTDSEKGGKLSILSDKVEELFASGKKILVFSQFVKFIDIMKGEFLPKLGAENIFELTGSTRDRAKPVLEFQNRKGAALMLVSLRAGGTGITLSSADYVFMADPWWNPAVEEQAIDRVHRIGRKGDVFIYRMIAQGTVEERVRKLQADKRRIFDEILGGLKDVSSRDKFIETVSDILA